jgi:hypothetical protein
MSRVVDIDELRDQTSSPPVKLARRRDDQPNAPQTA